MYLSIIILIKQYNDEGRPPHNLINVISYTCFMEILMGFQVPLLFLKNAEYHDLYKTGFKIDYIIADRTLRKYRSDYKELYQ